MKIESTFKIKNGLAEMLKGGVIMDVVNAEQAVIAEKSGAVAVMALERIPADIRAEGGVARMSSVETIQEVIDSVSIPVMAKARIGHFVEAQMLESLGIDFIDESEVLTPADDKNHIYKHDIKTPFVNGATVLVPVLHFGLDVFVGSGIFKSGDPKERAEAIVIATTNYDNPEKLVEVSKELGEPMVGLNIDDLDETEKLAKRGW